MIKDNQERLQETNRKQLFLTEQLQKEIREKEEAWAHQLGLLRDAY